MTTLVWNSKFRSVVVVVMNYLYVGSEHNLPWLPAATPRCTSDSCHGIFQRKKSIISITSTVYINNGYILPRAFQFFGLSFLLKIHTYSYGLVNELLSDRASGREYCQPRTLPIYYSKICNVLPCRIRKNHEATAFTTIELLNRSSLPSLPLSCQSSVNNSIGIIECMPIYCLDGEIR